MHIMHWEEVCYEIHYYKLNFHKSKLPLFHVFHEFSFFKIYIYVNKVIFDWNKYTSNSNYFITW